jgi:hypothetical protein
MMGYVESSSMEKFGSGMTVVLQKPPLIGGTGRSPSVKYTGCNERNGVDDRPIQKKR